RGPYWRTPAPAMASGTRTSTGDRARSAAARAGRLKTHAQSANDARARTAGAPEPEWCRAIPAAATRDNRTARARATGRRSLTPASPPGRGSPEELPQVPQRGDHPIEIVTVAHHRFDRVGDRGEVRGDGRRGVGGRRGGRPAHQGARGRACRAGPTAFRADLQLEPVTLLVGSDAPDALVVGHPRGAGRVHELVELAVGHAVEGQGQVHR